MGEQLRGYLVVKVLEAAGHNGEDVKVWDDTMKEAFVKSKMGLRYCHLSHSSKDSFISKTKLIFAFSLFSILQSKFAVELALSR